MTIKVTNGTTSQRNGTEACLRRHEYLRRGEEKTKRILKNHALEEEAESKREIASARAKGLRRRTRNY